MNRAQRRAQKAKGRVLQNKRLTLQGRIQYLQRTLDWDIEKQAEKRTKIDRMRAEFEEHMAGIVDELADECGAMSDDTPDDEAPSAAKKKIESQLNGAISEEFADYLVKLRWRNVQTADEALQTLAQLAVDRWVFKADLGYVLCVIDGIACNLIDRGIAAPNLTDQQVVEAAALEAEKTYLPEKWALSELGKLRERLISYSWRGCQANSFDAIAALGVGLRAVDLRKQRHSRDMVIESELSRVPGAEQAKVFERFRARIQNDLDALESFHKVLKETAAEEELTSAALKPAAPPYGSEQVKHLKTEAPAEKERTRPHKIIDIDRDVMRFGQRVWEESYGQGFGENVAQAWVDGELDYLSKRDAWSEESRKTMVMVLMFSGQWAVHAFQRVQTSHTFAAALMCSDPDEESLKSIEPQWKAFSVMVPNGLLVVEDECGKKIEYTRVFVAVYANRAEMVMAAPGLEGDLVGEAAYENNLAQLLAASVEDQETETKRAFVLAKRLVAGLLLTMQNKEHYKTRDVSERKGRPGRKGDGEPAHRLVIVGHPVTVDCRDAVKKYIEEGHGRKRSGHHSPPAVRFVVRGHYRQQAHGPRHSLRKTIWVQPFWKGAEGMPIVTSPKKMQTGVG